MVAAVIPVVEAAVVVIPAAEGAGAVTPVAEGAAAVTPAADMRAHGGLRVLRDRRNPNKARVAMPARAAGQGEAIYLALGDSIPFGLNVNLLPTNPSQPLPTPGEFIGYPEIIGQVEPWLQVLNAACPGETSGSFYIAGAADYGCHSNGPQGQPPFKMWIGLHVSYPGTTQLQYAVQELHDFPERTGPTP